MGAESQDKLLNGTPEERIEAWLEVTKNEDGHFKQGDWMVSLMPHLHLHSIDSKGPHPSVTFSYTVQEDHGNRMNNLHGGCAATLFDFCTTMPLTLISKPGFWQYLGVSRTLNVTYMRPARIGDEVLIQCEVVQAGKNLATLRGVMRRKSDGVILSICEHGKVSIDPTVPKL